MSRWKIYTPQGVQDILFDECFLKRRLESKLRSILSGGGFYEVETPTLEFYDTFSADTDLTPQETMFKFFDQQGRILVLRPEMTIAVARLAATKLKEAVYPLRLSYVGNAFRYNELGGGKQKEFTQAGAEIIGVECPEADADVIALAINCLKASGLENFQVDIGQVEFFKGLMGETGLSAADTEQMRVLIDKKDFLGIEELVGKHRIRGELKDLILGLPGMFGSVEVIEKAESIAVNSRSLKALANLRDVLDILQDYGLGRYVSVDLGMVQSLNYYTGVIFRGFTYGMGFPVVSGGRYDGLVGKFGKSCPSTGFSLGINMLMTALQRQNIPFDRPSVDTLVCYDGKSRKTAFTLCGELRKQGLSAEMDITGAGTEELRRYASSKGIGGIMRVIDGEAIELYNLKSGETAKTSVKELLERAESRKQYGG